MPTTLEPKAQYLLEQFITDLDLMSSNGVVRHLDTARISDLREHYLNQCPAQQQLWLAEQIDTILTSKLHYFEREKSFSLHPRTEKKILENLRQFLLDLKQKAPKYIGWLLTGRWFNPAEFIRGFIQPTIANTILSFSLMLNPPPVHQSAFSPNSSDTQPMAACTNHAPAPSHSKYLELEKVKPYKNDYIPLQPEEKKPVLKKINKPKANKDIHSDLSTVSAPVAMNTVEENPIQTDFMKTLSRSTRQPQYEIRPMHEIQQVFYLNETRLKNCLTKIKGAEKPHKIPLRFDITPSGKTKNITIMDSRVDSAVADKIALQIYQFRFNPVAESNGDQTVYYTLFF